MTTDGFLHLLGLGHLSWTAFFIAVGTIIIIDLVLAGDNAIVIALAARSLPPTLQKKAIIWGTVCAVVVRTIMTLLVVWLLKIPGLLLLGGLALLWVAFRLLTAPDNAHDSKHNPANFAAALKTIIIADAVMGIDNVLGVAGAAHGSFILVVFGLLVSVPIMVWGSTLALKLIERFPATLYIGSGVLVYTGVMMMTSEPFFKAFWLEHAVWKYTLLVLACVIVLGAGWKIRKKRLVA